MADGRRFEDYVPIEDLLKKDSQVLLAEIWQQTVKTNGTVAKLCDEQAKIKEELKLKATVVELDKIEVKVDDKVGTKELNRMEKIFIGIGGSIGLLLTIFNIWDRIAGG